MQPTLEDLEFDQASKEDAIRYRASDFFTDGVLNGLQVSIENNAIYVQPGIGYVNGERILVTSPALVTDTIQDGFVFVKYIQVESQPETHFITGELHNTRATDSFEVLLTGTDDPIMNGLLLAGIQSQGVVDKRTYMELKLSNPVSVDPPVNLAVTTGFEAEVTYTS